MHSVVDNIFQDPTDPANFFFSRSMIFDYLRRRLSINRSCRIRCSIRAQALYWALWIGRLSVSGPAQTTMEGGQSAQGMNLLL